MVFDFGILPQQSREATVKGYWWITVRTPTGTRHFLWIARNGDLC